MPALVWHDLSALLSDRPSATCVAVAEALHPVSHDRLTRRRQADGSGQRLLERTWRTVFVWERGSLLIADTVLPKPCATAMEGLAWVYSSRARKPVDGFSLGLRVWPDGVLRIPLGLRLGRRGGPSQVELA